MMFKQYCILCGKILPDNLDYQAWIYEHHQKDHPTYYATQIGIIE